MIPSLLVSFGLVSVIYQLSSVNSIAAYSMQLKALPKISDYKSDIRHHCNNPSSLLALSKMVLFLFSYHHFGAAFFIRVSMLRIPIRFQALFNFPEREGCSTRKLIAKPLSRYSI